VTRVQTLLSVLAVVLLLQLGAATVRSETLRVLVMNERAEPIPVEPLLVRAPESFLPLGAVASLHEPVKESTRDRPIGAWKQIQPDVTRPDELTTWVRIRSVADPSWHRDQVVLPGQTHVDFANVPPGDYLVTAETVVQYRHTRDHDTGSPYPHESGTNFEPIYPGPPVGRIDPNRGPWEAVKLKLVRKLDGTIHYSLEAVCTYLSANTTRTNVGQGEQVDTAFVMLLTDKDKLGKIAGARAVSGDPLVEGEMDLSDPEWVTAVEAAQTDLVRIREVDLGPADIPVAAVEEAISDVLADAFRHALPKLGKAGGGALGSLTVSVIHLGIFPEDMLDPDLEAGKIRTQMAASALIAVTISSGGTAVLVAIPANIMIDVLFQEIQASRQRPIIEAATTAFYDDARARVMRNAQGQIESVVLVFDWPDVPQPGIMVRDLIQSAQPLFVEGAGPRDDEWVFFIPVVAPRLPDANQREFTRLYNEGATAAVCEVQYLGNESLDLKCDLRDLVYSFIPEMTVAAPSYIVKKGNPIQFHGTLMTQDGLPVIEALLGVQDPVAQTTQLLDVDASGRFSYTSSTDFLTKPGGYAFIFRCSETPERVLTVALLDPSANSVDLASIGMPIGDQGTIAESFLAEPKAFTTVTRTTTGVSPPTGTTLPGPPTPPSRPESLRMQAAAVAQEAVQASLRKSGSSSTSRAEVVAALTSTSRSSSTSTGVSSGATAYLDTIAIDDAEAMAKSAINRSALAVDQREALVASMDRSTMFYSVVRLDPFLGVVTADTATSQQPGFGSGEVKMVVQSDPNVGPETPPEFLATIALDDGGVLAIAATGIAEESPPTAHGLLDVVIVIDKSGSMADDIECVQRGVDTILGEMAALAQQQNISLQVGLVLFSYTGEGNVFETCPLSVDIEAARQFVAGLNPQEVGGDEDLYSALMYAMNEPVEGQQIDMGWRTGAAKIAIPITDEAPKSDNFNVLQVAQVAEDLDPVHMYSLIMPQGPLTWLDSTESSLKELARVTGGEAVKVQDAEALPRAIVDAVALAIRRHKEEIYRQDNPPYLLYGVAGGMGGVLLVFVAGLFLFRRRRVEMHNVPPALPIDSDLTGDTAFHRTDG
jgi:hypothetical protein